MKYWKLNPVNTIEGSRMGKDLGVSPLIGGILQGRGMDLSAAKCFLTHQTTLHDPYLMKDMDKAVEIIRDAISEKKKIAVFGDYDCDGVTATVILVDYLSNIGGDVIYYIPHREEEGYGMNQSAVQQLHELGIQLIITVDNGISGIEEIALAKELGMQVVVTDHHSPREELPAADAIINPHQEGCDYPFKELCGAGVAFKLACALDDDLEGYETLLEYADLLAIGTVADVVDLKDENRTFVREGITALKDSHRTGLNRLLVSMGADLTTLNAETISFGLAPRINSVGRLDTAELAVLLLLTEDDREAEEIIEQIQQHNQTRKEIENQIFEEIKIKVEKYPEILNERILVFYGEGWNAGVIGIVASRIVNRFGKPTLIIATQGDEAKGSGRSVEGVSLIDGIFACSEELSRYGGHPMAVGFSLETCKIPAFTEKINGYAKEHYFKMPVDGLDLHYICEPSEITLTAAHELQKLEPFGAGNERPNLGVMGAKVVKIQALSEGKHQKIFLEKNGVEFQVLFFGMRKEALCCRLGDRVDVVFTLSVNSYHGVDRVSLKGLDLHLYGLSQEQYFEGIALYDNLKRRELKGKGYLPTREEVGIIYRYIRQKRQLPAILPAIYLASTEGEMPYIRFLIAIDAMLELGLIMKKQNAEETVLMISPITAKVSLETSTVIRSLAEDET